MPNSKSAEKRLRQDLKRRGRNRARLAKLREARRTFQKFIDAGEVDEAKDALQACYAALDRAGRHNTISPNKAARLKSRLTKRLNTAAA